MKQDATHGGKRTGAGRPSKAALAVVEAKDTLAELQAVLRNGLARAADSFPDLIDAEVEEALNGQAPDRRQKSRQFLIKNLMDMIKVSDAEDTPIKGLLQQWIKVEGDLHVDVAGEGEGHTVRVEGDSVEGTERRILSRGPT